MCKEISFVEHIYIYIYIYFKGSSSFMCLLQACTQHQFNGM